MAEPQPSPLDEPLARFARALPLATPGSLPPLAAVLGRGVRWGLGLRSDTRLPFGGTVRLLHWIASPYSDAPDGIVEDCQSARLRQVCSLAGATLGFAPEGASHALPSGREDRRNLLSRHRLMGLRGWDIPHDRHMAVTDLGDGAADITGTMLPETWHSDWLLTVTLASEALALRVAASRIPSA